MCGGREWNTRDPHVDKVVVSSGWSTPSLHRAVSPVSTSSTRFASVVERSAIPQACRRNLSDEPLTYRLTQVTRSQRGLSRCCSHQHIGCAKWRQRDSDRNQRSTCDDQEEQRHLRNDAAMTPKLRLQAPRCVGERGGVRAGRPPGEPRWRAPRWQSRFLWGPGAGSPARPFRLPLQGSTLPPMLQDKKQLPLALWSRSVC